MLEALCEAYAAIVTAGEGSCLDPGVGSCRKDLHSPCRTIQLPDEAEHEALIKAKTQTIYSLEEPDVKDGADRHTLHTLLE